MSAPAAPGQSPTLIALALAETVRRIATEVSRVERGVIDRDLFYERVADEIVSLNDRAGWQDT